MPTLHLARTTIPVVGQVLKRGTMECTSLLSIQETRGVR